MEEEAEPQPGGQADIRCSDVSDLFPKRLRYSEEVLHFCDGGAADAGVSQAGKGLRPLKVYARIKPAGGVAAATGARADGTSGSTAVAIGVEGLMLQATPTEISQQLRGGGKSMAYSFSGVFQGSDQQQFYDHAVEPLLEDLVGLRTGSSVFMAYGASGTGKSYTMQGTAGQPGMIPRALQRLFTVLAERGKEHQVHLCFYEVYENRVYDLLQSARLGKRQAQHLPIQVLGASCCVPGLLRCHCSSAEAGARLYAAAARIRTQSATQTNSESSRSHAVFTVQLLEVEHGAVTGRSTTMSLVDLAGAERAGRTRNVGTKLRESANINTSLSVLGRCLVDLRYNQAAALRGQGGGGGTARVIPVRESSLTTLFKGVLTGQGNLVLSVHLSQHGDEYDTNRHTLSFGALAARVHMAAAAPAPAAAQLPGAAPSGAGAAATKAGRTRVRPVVEEPSIAEVPEEEEEAEGEEHQQGGAKRQETGEEATLGRNTEDGNVAPPVGEGGEARVQVGDASAVLAALQAQVQQLQQQLALVEEGARAVAVAEWEELVASGREELEEVQQRVEELEAAAACGAKELTSCQRELATARRELEAVRKELKNEREAGKVREQALEQQVRELQAASGAAASAGARGGTEQAGPPGQHQGASAGGQTDAQACLRPAAAPQEVTLGAAGPPREAELQPEPGAREQERGVGPVEQTAGPAGREERAPLARLNDSGGLGSGGGRGGSGSGGRAASRRRAAAAAAATAVQREPQRQQHPGSAVGTAGAPGQGGLHSHPSGTAAAAKTGGKRRRAPGGDDDDGEEAQDHELQGACGAASGEVPEPRTLGGQRSGAATGAVTAGRTKRWAMGAGGEEEEACATAGPGATPVAARTRRKRQAR